MLKGNTAREKWQYFKDYYLKTTLVIGAAIVFGIYILYTTVFAYKSPVLTVLIISSEEPDCDGLEQKLEEFLDVDYVAVEWMSQDSSNLSSVLPTRFAAGDIDILISPDAIYKKYAQEGAMEDVDGVSVQTSKVIKSYLSDTDSLVIGVVKNSNDVDEKRATFNYLIREMRSDAKKCV